MHALRKLAVNATGRDKEVLEGSAQVLEAQVTPVATALPLPQYVGVYGVRHITNDDGKLSFQREGGPKTATGGSRRQRVRLRQRSRCSG